MNDEAQIRAALAEWHDAFCSKDVSRLMALYAPDAVIFDAIPPFTSSVEAMGTKTAGCLPYFPDTFGVETRDLTITTGAELAAAHFLWRFIDLPPGHPAGRHWLRSSILWRRQADGPWRIAHDHCSAPFDPHTEKAVLSLEGSPPATAPEVCPSNPVGWFEIYVQDMDRAKAFYQRVFGVEFTRLESPAVELWAFPMHFDRTGISGALVRMEGFASGDNSVLVYFHCTDCEVEATRAVAAGGQLCKPKMSIGQYGFIALVTDSEGNMIGLHSMQ